MNQTRAAQSNSHSSQGRCLPHPPTRCARASCAERLTCRGPHPRSGRDVQGSCPTPFPPGERALYYCADCGTNQCEGCELLIHEQGRFREHAPRQPVAAPDPQLLCSGFSCLGENLADIRCHTCQRSLCYACDHQIHLLSKRFAHVKVRFQHYLQRQAQRSEVATEEEDEEEQYLSAEAYDSSSYEEGAMMDFRSLMEPDIVSDTHSSGGSHGAHKAPTRTSTLLVDDKEVLQVSSAAEFASRLECEPETPVKVVSIFGNTGEGKSHTLNQAFFGGQRVFQVSPQQQSCTVGVWAAHCPDSGLLTIDTEGLLGLADNECQRTRLLLKILAVSDIVIYRTRAERLGTDMFAFLGDASRAYVDHFAVELKELKERCKIAGPISSLGPAVIVFHETMHTTPLAGENGRSPVEELKFRFGQTGQNFDAFSALEYVGIRTKSLPTCFDGLRAAVVRTIENSSVRSARPVEVVFEALKLLNEKFSGNIAKTIPSTFPDQYFTCPIVCIACNARCKKTVNHKDSHACEGRCKYLHEYDNKVHQCKDCYEKNGREVLLTPQTAAKNDSALMSWAKYAWSGYVLECPCCGVIYQSRQYWYGNKNPDETVTRVEIVHVWPDSEKPPSLEPNNTAQKVLDGLQLITETVTTYSAKPTRTLLEWANDQIAPNYWVPNYQILKCHSCPKTFTAQENKHHCRACGNGFCEECSSKKRPVPERGWGTEPVRVCDACFDGEGDSAVNGAKETGESEVTARKVGEVIRSTFGVVATAMEYPIGLIKDSARPAYWTADAELKQCAVCKKEFDVRRPIHHCRSCGRGVCDACSTARRPVVSRGWEGAVRVCDDCDKREEL
ncbi:zinc finger FYVE domain-containing protein 1-like isoform X2 [Haemaphysalis longicornis]